MAGIKISLLIYILFVFSTNLQAQASGFAGAMVCTVKSQHLQEIQEGKATTYSSYEKGIEVGDKIDFDYYQQDGNWSVSLGTKEQDAYLGTHRKKYLWPRDKLHLSGGIFVAYESPIGDYGIFHSDVIRLRNLETNLVLKRYYKDDWHGVFSSLNNDLVSWVFTFDCRQKRNELELAIQDAFSYVK